MISSFQALLAVAAIAIAGLVPPVAAADDLHVSGNVLYRERIALPGSASVRVALVDLAQSGGEPLASAVLEKVGQVPIAFRLDVPAGSFKPDQAYGLVARIDVDGVTWFANDKPVLIDPARLADPASVLVHRVGAAAGVPEEEAPITGVVWHLAQLGEKAADPQVNTTLTFHKDGRISGEGGCNRFSGAADLKGSALRIGNVSSTMMACPEPGATQEREFYEALSKAVAFAVEGETLVLLNEAGGAVARLKAQQ